ncbi:polysaccharide biosynthesis protein [Vagococcus elongatus]|uniref:Polysaccharide biosynthesis protein n=1 Tax=Vagococcus elongatus TaxID=180344 RepID=A0A430B243_9ENTE|nr:nucleoside-diphosphate sugar epimerase/dehydratase [Vagococcus elongatus]RSU14396.1 polysaccharide biosynthesis protein [Vagococcus elongatus]
MSRRVKICLIFFIDSLFIVMANLFAHIYMNPLVFITPKTWMLTLMVQLGIYWILGAVLNIFNRVNRQANLREIIAISTSLFVGLIVELAFLAVVGDSYSLRYVLLTYVFSVILICGSRIGWKLFIEYRIQHGNKISHGKRTLIIGAGAGGIILIETLKHSVTNDEIDVVGFIDDDKDKHGIVICGKSVLGTIDDLPQVIDDYEIEQLTVAIPSLPPSGYEKIVDIAQQKHIKVNSMPSIEDIASGEVRMNKLREIDVVDLLGREEVELDMAIISNQLTDKVVMVTGAGGSIGSEICRQVLRFSPKQLLLLGHGENSIYQINRELNKVNTKTEIIPLIADIRDYNRMFEVMSRYRPNKVYHAAAHKHVPMMEYNPGEALKNNVYGTKNTAEAAVANNIDSFVMISTDKATNPPNVMGATKRIAEMLITGLNGRGKTKFSAVRFGNVLGSRGSVVPVFKEQIESGGPVTVTDFEMTRYFMTIPEASRLVLQAGALAKGGEIFILDMGEPVKIYDLAKKMIQLSGYSTDDIEIVESGIRPGEKLYEELLVDKERADVQVYDKIFVGNVNGFGYDEVLARVEKFNKENEKQLTKEIIMLANESIN